MGPPGLRWVVGFGVLGFLLTGDGNDAASSDESALLGMRAGKSVGSSRWTGGRKRGRGAQIGSGRV